MPTLTTEELQALDDDAFKKVVNDQIPKRKGDPELWALLLSPKLTARTTAVLLEIRTQLDRDTHRRKEKAMEFQQECHRRGPQGRSDWFEYRKEWDDWRYRAFAFRRQVEARQFEAKQARRKHEAERQERVRERADDGLRAALARSRTAQRDTDRALRQIALQVREHQAKSAAAGLTPRDHDRALWAVLDTATLQISRDGDRATVRHVMDTFWLTSDVSENSDASEPTAAP